MATGLETMPLLWWSLGAFAQVLALAAAVLLASLAPGQARELIAATRLARTPPPELPALWLRLNPPRQRQADDETDVDPPSTAELQTRLQAEMAGCRQRHQTVHDGFAVLAGACRNAGLVLALLIIVQTLAGTSGRLSPQQLSLGIAHASLAAGIGALLRTRMCILQGRLRERAAQEQQHWQQLQANLENGAALASHQHTTRPRRPARTLNRSGRRRAA